MNRKSIILSAWLLTSAAHAFAQQEVPQESTFLNPERVTIKDGRDSMNITIKGRQGEPDFTFSRTVMYPSDEVTVTRERRTHPDFPIRQWIDRQREELVREGRWADRNDRLDQQTIEWMQSLGFEVETGDAPLVTE